MMIVLLVFSSAFGDGVLLVGNFDLPSAKSVNVPPWPSSWAARSLAFLRLLAPPCACRWHLPSEASASAAN